MHLQWSIFKVASSIPPINNRGHIPHIVARYRDAHTHPPHLVETGPNRACHGEGRKRPSLLVVAHERAVHLFAPISSSRTTGIVQHAADATRRKIQAHFFSDAQTWVAVTPTTHKPSRQGMFQFTLQFHKKKSIPVLSISTALFMLSCSCRYAVE